MATSGSGTILKCSTQVLKCFLKSNVYDQEATKGPSHQIHICTHKGKLGALVMLHSSFPIDSLPHCPVVYTLFWQDICPKHLRSLEHWSAHRDFSKPIYLIPNCGVYLCTFCLSLKLLSFCSPKQAWKMTVPSSQSFPCPINGRQIFSCYDILLPVTTCLIHMVASQHQLICIYNIIFAYR